LEQVVSFLFNHRQALFSKSQFAFGARPSILLLIAIIVSLALLLYFLYSTPAVRLPLRWRIALISLRCLLVAAIVLFVMRPIIVVPSVIPQSSYVAVLMDDSSSMKLPAESSETRLDAVKQLMSANSSFYSQLAEKFKLRNYKFAASADRIQNASELSADGTETNLTLALDQASRESAGLPMSGAIVISDGADNAGSNDDDRASNLGTTCTSSVSARIVSTEISSYYAQLPQDERSPGRRLLLNSSLRRAVGGRQSRSISLRTTTC
jgi:hypothetical protein